MTSPTVYTLDLALIESRAAELGWDDAVFVAEIGIHLRDLHRVLRPDRVTLAWLCEIAESLGLHPADLIVAVPNALSEHPADADVLEALLAPRSRPRPVSVETLSIVLRWPVDRVVTAVDTLTRRLQKTPFALLREQDGYLIASRFPSPYATSALSAVRARANPLTVEDCVPLLTLLHQVSMSMPHDDQPPAAPAVDPAISCSLHPDLLFALLLTDAPAPCGPPEPGPATATAELPEGSQHGRAGRPL
ncbi:hypothetical protein [Nonomuraea guangzhouensis]|uniref:HTH cro/C1-type domain-containing protein n=1 Tax=Nonomuraea guangzhouensis TaxID=1291555 RepID=A0ABW4GT30_9ACTN|nr:hypothetical protein [Nonomuraea guangzhouensis]